MGNFLNAKCMWSAICSSNVKRRVGNFLHHAKLVCPLPQSVWWGQIIRWKFSQLQYSPQKLCQSTFSLSLSLSLSLSEINTTQCLVDWDSLTLILFGGKKKRFKFIIFRFSTQQPGILRFCKTVCNCTKLNQADYYNFKII